MEDVGAAEAVFCVTMRIRAVTVLGIYYDGNDSAESKEKVDVGERKTVTESPQGGSREGYI